MESIGKTATLESAKHVQVFIGLRKGLQPPNKLEGGRDVSGDFLGPHGPMADNKCLSSLFTEHSW